MTNEELDKIETIAKRSIDSTKELLAQPENVLELVAEIKRLKEQCKVLGDKHQVGQ